MHGQVLNPFSQSNICQTGDFRRKIVTPLALVSWDLFKTINIITISGRLREIQASKSDSKWGNQHLIGIYKLSMILLIKMSEFVRYFLWKMFQKIYNEVLLFQKIQIKQENQKTNILFKGTVSDWNSELFMGCLVNVPARAGKLCLFQGKSPTELGKGKITQPFHQSGVFPLCKSCMH